MLYVCVYSRPDLTRYCLTCSFPVYEPNNPGQPCGTHKLCSLRECLHVYSWERNNSPWIMHTVLIVHVYMCVYIAVCVNFAPIQSTASVYCTSPTLYKPHTVQAPHCTSPTLYKSHTVQAPHCTSPTLYKRVLYPCHLSIPASTEGFVGVML